MRRINLFTLISHDGNKYQPVKTEKRTWLELPPIEADARHERTERYIKLELKNVQRSPFRVNNCHAVHPTPSKLHPPPCVLAPGGNNRHPELSLSLSLVRARKRSIPGTRTIVNDQQPRRKEDRRKNWSESWKFPRSEKWADAAKRRNRDAKDRRTQNARGGGWICGSFYSRKI